MDQFQKIMSFLIDSVWPFVKTRVSHDELFVLVFSFSFS